MEIITDGIAGLTKMLGTEPVTASENLWGNVASAVIAAFFASKYTRQRVSQGKEAVIGFF